MAKQVAVKAEPRKEPKKKEPKKKGKFFRKIKEVFSELKKVTWPSFGHALKQTGVVCAVVLFFLIIITGADTGLTALLNLLRDATAV